MRTKTKNEEDIINGGEININNNIKSNNSFIDAFETFQKLSVSDQRRFLELHSQINSEPKRKEEIIQSLRLRETFNK